MGSSLHGEIPKLPYKWKPKRTMTVTSFAFGEEHTELLNIMAPTVTYYANRHRMDCHLFALKTRLAPDRPPAWDKLVIIRSALDAYDTVLWIDADAIIVNPKRDIRKDLSPRHPIHLVAHRIGRRVIPNTGIWVLQNDPQVLQLLDDMWKQEQYFHHRWWEQAAFMKLVGYDPEKAAYVGETRYSPLVSYLGNEWNSRDKDQADRPYIYHYCNGNKPVDDMRKRAEAFVRTCLLTKLG